MWFQSNCTKIWQIESNIHAPVVMNLLNLPQKSDKVLIRAENFYLFTSTCFNKLNNTWALI